ncbi:MAG: SRPBCC family protein [Actinomycetota bacterium]
MRVQAQITIDWSRDLVWEIFTRPEGWETWWGGPLSSVEPGWEEGAKLHWDLGMPSTIVGVVPTERVEISGYHGGTETYTFTDVGSSTLVSYVQDTGSAMGLADVGVAQQECEAVLARLKTYVEESSPA